MKPITYSKIVNHGVDHSQYFQGAGTAFTQFENCYTGVGNTPHEALEDAIEQAAENDYDVENIINDEENADMCAGCPCFDQENGCQDENCELHVFVTLYIK